MGNGTMVFLPTEDDEQSEAALSALAQAMQVRGSGGGGGGGGGNTHHCGNVQIVATALPRLTAGCHRRPWRRVEAKRMPHRSTSAPWPSLNQ